MIAFALALCLAITDEPTLSASWSTTAVVVGEHATLDVVLRGECAVDAELMELPPLDLATWERISGPEYSSTDAYRCTWRLDVLARRAGTLRASIGVRCQSAEERVVAVPPLEITGATVIEPESSFVLTPSAPAVFVGEPFSVDVEIRLGLAAFATGLELVMPWLHDVVRLSATASDDAVTFPIDGEPEPMRLTRSEAGDALVLRTRLVVSAPVAGRLSWAGSRLRPRTQSSPPSTSADPRLVIARAGGVEVLAVPQASRPPGYVDGIGIWSVRSRADRVDVAVGEPFRVEVVVEAEAEHAGNLPFATLPATWTLDGCEATRRDDRREALARVLTFEVRATRAGAIQIAPYEVAVFDPRARRFAVARSAPIPLRVTATSADPAPPVQRGLGVWRWAAVLVGGAGVVGIIGAAMRRLRARRERARLADPREAFARVCAGVAADDPLRASKALAHAFALVLDLDLGTLAGGGARAALERAGVGTELADRVAGFIERDEAAAFSAPRSRGTPDEARRLDEARDLVEALLRERSARPA